MIPRSTLKETYDFIIADLDAGIADLPGVALNGKATKWAAHALKSRAALYAAKNCKKVSPAIIQWFNIYTCWQCCLPIIKWHMHLLVLLLTVENTHCTEEVELTKRHLVRYFIKRPIQNTFL